MESSSATVLMITLYGANLKKTVKAFKSIASNDFNSRFYRLNIINAFKDEDGDVNIITSVCWIHKETEIKNKLIEAYNKL